MAHGKSTVVDISPHQRVQEIPGEHLEADAGKLVCTACHTELSLKLSIVRSHVQSTRHQNGKASLEKERNRQQLVKQSFLSYQERNKKSLARCGLTEAVPIDHCLQRIKVVRSLLTAGIPLAKLDKIRHLRESGTTHLTSVSYLAEYIPFIQEQEADLLKKELAEAHSTCSVIFDGSTCLGEALAILLRFVDQDWHLKQRLVRFHIVAKSMSVQQLARALITYLSLKFSLSSDAMVAAI